MNISLTDPKTLVINGEDTEVGEVARAVAILMEEGKIPKGCTLKYGGFSGSGVALCVALCNVVRDFFVVFPVCAEQQPDGKYLVQASFDPTVKTGAIID